MVKSDSRTSKSIKNSSVALVFYFINLILQFFSRKIFLDYLGAEVLGLNTTAQNLQGFLNLAELGIGTAVAYSLYKPLFERDHQAINDIVSIQGWLYHRIAFIIMAGSVILMCFFPLLFAKAQVPLLYTYGSFVALLVAALLGYFVNYRQVVLSADQKEYKITQSVQGGKVVKVILQLLAIRYLWNGYLWWMVFEVLIAIVTSYVLDRSIREEYPWLESRISEGKRLKKAYPEIVRKTKQLFFHKIGVFILTQTSPLVIYAYASLTLVAIYGNYLLITLGVTALMNALLNGLNASIGNLVAENDKWHIKKLFWEITLLRMWLASIVCFGLYMLGDSFVTLWVGEEYILPSVAFVILIINTFIGLTRTNDSFLAAYGLFQDVWAPVTEASLNLGLSIVLGHFFGLNGILAGVMISLLVIVCGWKPYFLYHNGFKESVWEYVRRYSKYVVILVSLFVFCSKISCGFFTYSVNTYWDWSVYGLKSISLYASLSALVLCLTDAYAISLLKRVCCIIINLRK